MARRHKQGIGRAQEALLPPRVEDYVSETSVVRAIDAYVDTLELEALGFNHTTGDLAPGQPAFDPALLLKRYLYGDLNRVRSSRRLERESQRNLELIWLLEGLVPSYRTIAEIRRVDGNALRAANRDFVVRCQELEIVGGEPIGIDGSFFKASASDASITTRKSLEAALKQIARDLEAYTQDLDANDAQEEQTGDGLGEDPELARKLDQLKARQQAQLERLEANGETQFSRTDPDARALTKGKQHVTGDNVQNCVDDKHKLIVHHDVTNAGNDQNQLSGQCREAMAVLEVEMVTAVADGGYYREAELAACEAAGVTVYIPIPDKHRAVTGQGRLSGKRFQYNQTHNVYICPAGEVLPPRGQPQHKNGVWRTGYSRPAGQCRDCPLTVVCLPDSGAARRIYRSEHAQVVAAHQQRMAEQGPENMRQRAGLVEHPFGTLKRWLGWDHFLVRGFRKVRGEMSLMVLGYNLLRVINQLGVGAFRDYCARRAAARNAQALAQRAG